MQKQTFADVLRAHSRELGGQADEARAGYGDALDRGLPIVAATLRGLAKGAQRTGLAHARSELLRQVADGLIPGLLWSSWAPPPGWAGTAGPS